MPRVELRIPFSEKEEAKRRGARWDSEKKTWYIPEGIERSAFEEWLPTPQSPNIRAPGWSVIGSQRECWRCHRVSRVFAIVLPPGYEEIIVADDPADDCWQGGEDLVLLSYVDDVPDSVAAQLHRLVPRYRINYSQTTNSFYWMNHCEHCSAKLGDFETLHESGTFYDLGAGLTSPKLTIESFHQFAEPFSAPCGSHAWYARTLRLPALIIGLKPSVRALGAGHSRHP
jgi:Domain of unknown function (DUF5710)